MSKKQMEKSFASKKKNSVNFCSKIPLGPTVQEFWLEYNVGLFEWKLVDNIYSGPRNKLKNLLQEEKKKKTLV